MKTISLKKRIALVAVAALGAGLSTTSAAFAAPHGAAATSTVSSITLSRYTASPIINSAVAVNVGLTTAVQAASGATIALTGVLTSYPSGGFVGVTASNLTAAGSSATFAGGVSAASASGATVTLDTTTANGVTAASVASSSTVGSGSFSFTPTVAGDYVLTVFHDAVGGTSGAIDPLEARQTISITVASATAYSNSQSTSIMDDPDNSNNASTDEQRWVSKSIGTDAAQIKVTLLNSNGSAYNGATLLCEISGPGLVKSQVSATYADGDSRYSTVALGSTNNVGYCNVSADGTAGTATITVKALDSTTAATLGTIKTHTVKFYGTVATLTATQIMSVARAGTAIGCSNAADCDQADAATTPAVTLVGKDSGGNLVPGSAFANTVSAVIGDANVIGSASATAVTSETEAIANAATVCVSIDCNGLGYWNASITGATGATSGKSTTVTFRTLLSDGATYVTSAPITFSVGGAIAKTVATLSKTTYAPAESMILTITATDSSGNPAYDGQSIIYSGTSLVGSKSLGGSLPTTSNYIVGGKYANTANKLFAPVVGGTFTINGTGNDLAGTAFTVSASVTDQNAALMTQIDALNAKIVALNALIAKIMKKLGVK